MAPKGPVRHSHKQRIYDTLVGEIAAGRHEPGAQLPSVRDLAHDLGTSLSPVYQALQSLQEAGYIEKRGGSGCYVVDTAPELTLLQTVALGLSARAHVWGELDMLMVTALQRRGLNPLILDLEEISAERRLASVARSDVRAFVARAQGAGPARPMRSIAEQGKIILGLVEWEADTWPGLYRVLADHEAGARRVAEHLWAAGHRHVLVTAPRPAHLAPVSDRADNPQSVEPQGRAFVRAWREWGGRHTYVCPEAWEETLPRFDRRAVLEVFDAGDAPTAIFGTMDVLTAALGRLLRRHRPNVEARLERMGYYDTPWSQAADPPFSSVNLDLAELARQAGDVLTQALRDRESAPELRLVTPKLVLRSTGREGPA
jgi:DNA-binding LacI/PurR family transcriptional regulator